MNNNENGARSRMLTTAMLGIVIALFSAGVAVMAVWRGDARVHDALPAHPAMSASFDSLEKRIRETIQPSLFGAFDEIRAKEAEVGQMRLEIDDMTLRIRALELKH